MKLRIEISLAPAVMDVLRDVADSLQRIAGPKIALESTAKGVRDYAHISEASEWSQPPADISRLTVSTPEEIARLTLEEEARQAAAGGADE